MDKIKNIIIIISIIILILLIILVSLFILSLKKDDNNYTETEGDIGEVIEITKEREEVENISTFKAVELCIQKYYNMLNNQSSDFYLRNEDGEYYMIEQTKVNQKRLDLLSEEYIKSKNINLNNINEYLKITEEQNVITVLKMKKLIDTNIDKYIAQGLAINYNNEVTEEFYIIVNLDSRKGIFSIEPIEEEYNDIEQIEIENNNISIETNDNNRYYSEIYNHEKMASNYFLTYKRLALAKPEVLYDYYMDKEYKEQRFGNKNNFIKYVEDNKQEIQALRFSEYLVNYNEDITQFVCRDQYKNSYIFDEKLPMQFELKLDTYTIATDKFKETYNSTQEERKCQMNIDKFIQMINRHDYINSYRCISEGFKNNYLNTQEEFENYIKNRFFEYNKFTFKSGEKKGDSIYLVTIQISDLTGLSTELRDIDIIIQLNDDMDFEMSFAIQ